MTLPRAEEKAAASGAAHRPARPRQLPQVLNWHRVRRSPADGHLSTRVQEVVDHPVCGRHLRGVVAATCATWDAHYPAAMAQLSKHVISEVTVVGDSAVNSTSAYIQIMNGCIAPPIVGTDNVVDVLLRPGRDRSLRSASSFVGSFGA